MRWMWLGLLLLAIVVAAGLGAYYGDQSGSPTPEKEVVYPACDKVWQDGGLLPKNYYGCVNESGELKKPIWVVCFNRKGEWYIALTNRHILLGGECK